MKEKLNTIELDARFSMLPQYANDVEAADGRTTNDFDLYINREDNSIRMYVPIYGEYRQLARIGLPITIGHIFFFAHSNPPEGAIRLADGAIYAINDYLDFLSSTEFPITNESIAEPVPNSTNNSFYLVGHGLDETWIALVNNGNTLPDSSGVFEFNTDRNRKFFKAIKIDDDNFTLAIDDDNVPITFSDNGTGTFQIAIEFGMPNEDQIFLKSTNDTNNIAILDFQDSSISDHVHTLSLGDESSAGSGGGYLVTDSNAVDGSGNENGGDTWPRNLAATLCIWAFN